MPNRRPRGQPRKILVGWWGPGLEVNQQCRHRTGVHEAVALENDPKGPAIVASWEHDGRLRLRVLKRNWSEEAIDRPRTRLKRGPIAIDHPHIVWSSTFYYDAHVGLRWKRVTAMSSEDRRLMITRYLDPATSDEELIHDRVSWGSGTAIDA
ncbi:hypothetical protein CMEL01_16745 [Colletotrichum melonis]|uniref:Uncharacterized protein n=1 Tax=Colletotrichum melonis TaxID=1209925 RepID=A0AAI9U8T3_9PEZI|nr:hypothetical protein CMEL01_16745 [Colletotrichum melonis]